MKAVGYIRVSSVEQAKTGLSLEAQRTQIEKYCQFKGFELVEMYADEGVSGGKLLTSRNAGSQMYQALKNGQIKHLICAKLDRLFRNTIDALAQSQEFQNMGITLHLLDMNIDTSTPAGKLFYTMVAAFAQMERDQTSERVKTVFSDRKSKGYVLTIPPYGWSNVQGKLVENPSEQKVIQHIMTLYKSGLSIRKICNLLNVEKIKPQKATTWSSSSVAKIIQGNK